MQVVGLFSGMMQGSVNISSKIYCRFVSVHLDYKVIQFTYTYFTTSAGHGLPICRKR